MKIEAYDKYQKRWLLIEFEDQIHCNSFSSHSCGADVRICFNDHPAKNKEYVEDPDVTRWSDLEQITVLNTPSGEKGEI